MKCSGDGHSAANVDLLRGGAKALRRGSYLIIILGDVIDAERAGVVGNDRLFVAGHRIAQMDTSAPDDPTGWIGHDVVNGTAVNRLRIARSDTSERQHKTQKATYCEFHHSLNSEGSGSKSLRYTCGRNGMWG